MNVKKRIQAKLLRWFTKNQRDLPWRKTKDPYAIWVSEIMLQQTQVNTVIPYYNHFLKTFPTLRDLAKANLSNVLKVWEGLGYYSRARNLYQASRIIANHFKGEIPDTLKALLTLPGIGRYTAGAILSIAYNKEAPILDGNVKRVLARLFAISNTNASIVLSLRGGKRRSNPSKNEIAAPFGLAKTCKGDKLLCTDKPLRGKAEALLWQLSESLIPKGKASLFNQGLMDLGAMICAPKDPQCPKCPLCDLCKAWALGKPERFPSRTIKKKIPHIEAVAAVIRKDGKILLQQRPPKGLLGGLWEFPNWPLDGKKDLMEYLRLKVKSNLGLRVKCKVPLSTFDQTYSHFKLTLHVFQCQYLDGKITGGWVPFQKLQSLPLSRIHRRIAQTISGF